MKDKAENRFRLLLLLIRAKNYISSNYIALRKRVVVFFIFIVLSSSFWLYTALDDTYVAENKYPVEFSNLPKNKILAGEPPKKITLRVRGNGYTILNNKINPPLLEINVDDFSLGSQTIDSLSLFLISRHAKEIFAAELSKKNNYPLEILSTSPDTILFNFTKTKTKKVPVRVKFSHKENLFARQYIQNGEITSVPDSILVIGPSTIIDTISWVNTEDFNITELKDTMSKKTKLKLIPEVHFSVDKAKITIPVDKFTESFFEIPLLTKHTPDSISLKPFPRSVKVNYKVSLSNYNDVSETDFRPYIDYIDASQVDTSNSKIKVYIDSVPGIIYSYSIYPPQVDFLIELNNAKDRFNRRDR
ncbi:MAG: hypothetical protein JXA77_07245 [Bacteroidales bacterium]|nr:hypothetical protein [Bacteroidales bacterium]MBN2819671.1 hypothetical protein [Bacteroidales bacterium]